MEQRVLTINTTHGNSIIDDLSLTLLLIFKISYLIIDCGVNYLMRVNTEFNF